MVRGIDVVFLHTRDVPAMADWYAETLGLDLGHGDGHWQELRMASGSRFALDGGSPDPSEVERQPIMVSFRVDDIEAAVKTLAAKGVGFYPSVDEAVFDVGPTLVATFRDPEGRWMQISQPKA